MQWYCRFEWYPGVTREQVAKRLLEQHQAGGNRRPELVRAWYNLTGGGAGFLLLECNDPREVTAFLQPYMDILSWDVHAVYPLDYDQEIQRLQQVVQ